MSESEPNTNKLLKRINELLHVLNVISRDLVEIRETLMEATKVGSVPSITSPRWTQGIEKVRALFPNDLEVMLEFEETEKYILIRPRGYLGSDNFAKIATIVRDSGGEYISAGKESHFRVSKEP